MTEKRFTLDNEENGLCKCILMNGEEIPTCEVVELLNILNEENEQLKQVIAETEKMVQSTYDELTKLRCFKKNVLRIKHSWDYLMEAIQYD